MREMELWNLAAEEPSGRAVFDGPLSLCLLRESEEYKGDLDWTLSTKETERDRVHSGPARARGSRVRSNQKGA